jgi:hypothetical protein
VVELSAASMLKQGKGRERASRLGMWGRRKKRGVRSSAGLKAASALAQVAQGPR